MSPDDPRHGTNPGYNAGCRDLCCRRAHANYRKRLELDNLRGQPRIVPAIGVKRRIEGLRALGWSGAAILREVRISPGNLNRFIDPQTTTMTRAQHDKFVAAFERMIARPVEGTPHSISAARNLARRKGWITPDRWLDIDDPDEKPDPGWRERRWQRADLLAEWEFLLSSGASREEAAAQLGMNLEAIERTVRQARKAGAA